MKIVKWVLIGLAALVALFLIVALLMPSKYYIERSIEINKPVSVVFGEVVDLNKYKLWNPWARQDLDSKQSVEGMGVGQVYSWDGDTIGKGSITNENIIENKQIDQKVRFVTPFESEAYNGVKFEETANGTKVTWIMEGELDYPIMRFMKGMIESSVTSDFDKGLGYLKEQCEALKDEPAAEIVDFAGGKYYGVEDKAMNEGEIEGKMGAAYGEIMKFFGGLKLQPIGPPVAFTKAYDLKSGMWEFIAAMPVADNSKPGAGKVVQYSVPAGKVVKSVHIGPYNTVQSTYEKMFEYIKANNLTENGFSWEEFISDPQNTPPEKIITNIYIPVK